MAPEAFPHQTLDPVPVNGHSDILFGDGEAQSPALPVVGSSQHREQGVTGLRRVLKDPLKLGGA